MLNNFSEAAAEIWKLSAEGRSAEGMTAEKSLRSRSIGLTHLLPPLV
ncbi:MAG: hypothetical protein Q8R30_00885 [bacterium]|nr:hypothetical protein [bacterium]